MTLTKEEQRGIKKLEKRKNDVEVVIMIEDKLSKLCIMNRIERIILNWATTMSRKILRKDEQKLRRGRRY